jgi:hypothetical protein
VKKNALSGKKAGLWAKKRDGPERRREEREENPDPSIIPVWFMVEN